MSTHHERFLEWRKQFCGLYRAELSEVARIKTVTELEEQLDIIAPMCVVEKMKPELIRYFNYVWRAIEAELYRRKQFVL